MGYTTLRGLSSAKNRLDNPNSTLPHVSKAEEGNMGYNTPVQGLFNEIEHSGESGDNNVETERSTKRIRVTLIEHITIHLSILFVSMTTEFFCSK